MYILLYIKNINKLNVINISSQLIKSRVKKPISQVELGQIQFNQLLLSNEKLPRILNQVFFL